MKKEKKKKKNKKIFILTKTVEVMLKYTITGTNTLVHPI